MNPCRTQWFLMPPYLLSDYVFLRLLLFLCNSFSISVITTFIFFLIPILFLLFSCFSVFPSHQHEVTREGKHFVFLLLFFRQFRNSLPSHLINGCHRPCSIHMYAMPIGRIIFEMVRLYRGTATGSRRALEGSRGTYDKRTNVALALATSTAFSMR